MARRQRYHLTAATYHVMLRGNNGQPIFFSEADRIRMCLLIQQGVERFGHTIYAFCFMSNHIHLALRVADTNISQIMQHLAFRYARYINRKQKRVGHLFQGRFKSIVIDEERYLKELVRYIHLNPVRAGLVKSPDKYSWSSHKAYMQKDSILWISHDRVLKCFNPYLSGALNEYERYILNGIGIETELDFKSGSIEGILGDKEFADEVVEKVSITQNRKIELLDLITQVCERQNVTVEDLRMPGKHPKQSYTRALLALLVRETNGLSLEQLGQILNREASGLTKLANRLENKCTTEALIANDVQDMRRQIF